MTIQAGSAKISRRLPYGPGREYRADGVVAFSAAEGSLTLSASPELFGVSSPTLLELGELLMTGGSLYLRQLTLEGLRDLSSDGEWSDWSVAPGGAGDLLGLRSSLWPSGPGTIKDARSPELTFQVAFDALLGDTSEFEMVGTEEIAGVPTFRYVADRPAPQMSGPLAHTLNVDESGRLIRIQFPAIMARAAGSLDVTIEFSDFGTPVKIQEPTVE